ncbi:pseudaminic acid cytidylyltransferase [Citrobacter freundii]|nr:pseudaminic acid cytidylyltransferase [Citrobacter freundii]
MKSNSSLAIIPARGGSKRIPRKNIQPFRGRPMIAWSIEAALSSELFDHVMVSTDDTEIAELALSFGANVPFMRTANNSDDYATTSDVLVEVLEQYASFDMHFKTACCLYPTAPFVRASDLIDGYAKLLAGNHDVIFPVARFSYPVWRALQREKNGNTELLFPEYINARSQDLRPTYHDAGQWYWFNVEKFMCEKKIMGSNTGSVEIPTTHVQDIDTEEDWLLAELKHSRLFNE